MGFLGIDGDTWGRIGGIASGFIPGVGPIISAGINTALDANDRGEATNTAAGQLSAANTQGQNAINAGMLSSLGAIQSANAPYLQLGSQAANTLGGMMGFDMSGGGGGGYGPASYTPAPVQPATQTPQQRPEDLILSQNFQKPDIAEAAQHATQTSYVKMRAPDGEERDVPEKFAQMLEAKGAVRI